MKIIETGLSGLYTLEVERFEDQRGSFGRLFDAKIIEEETGIEDSIKHINHSYTAQMGTVRGMHFQDAPYAEDKIVYCLVGEIFDVAVDMRQESATFLHWHAEVLSAKNRKAFIIPKGFAHGFQALSDHVEMLYFMSEFYHKDKERGVPFDDPVLKINWPKACKNLSQKDQSYRYIKAPLERSK
ncbi:MAG: dTDP-4-dehydrorhamnose 3,5-epimerase [Spirochaetia bacterium]